MVGHSAGGLLIGLLPNHAKIKSVVAVACSSGYINQVAMPDRIVATILLKVYFPAATKLFGYLPAKQLGWGEDLPTQVALQWAQWCSSPGYIQNAFGKEIARHYYDDITMPFLSLNAADDPITTEANVADFLRLLPNAAIERRVLQPNDFGLKEIGHMGFFRAKNSALWPTVTDWLRP